MPLTVETFREFAERHGGDAVEVGGRLLFPDGAQCGIDEGRGSFRQEPPEGKYSRLQLRREYVAAKLKRAEQNFHRYRADVSEQAALASRYANLPHPGEGVVEHLHHLKRIAQKYRRELARVDKALSETPEGRAQRERAEVMRERQHEIARIHSRIVTTSLDGEEPADLDEVIAEAARREARLLADGLARQAGVKPLM